MAGLTLAGAVALGRGGSGPSALSAAAVRSAVNGAQQLAARYVADAWCTPLLAGTVGTPPAWPHRIATRAEASTLAAGPPRGQIPGRASTVLADVSDARAVLPAQGASWSITPRFCVWQAAYPRLETTGGRGRPSYAPLPKRLHDLDQIFDRFPAYLGRLTGVAVPVTVEVSYAIRVDGGPPRYFHLTWVTSLGMVPAGPRSALALSCWDLGGRGAYVTVQRDAPPGPQVVHSQPPGGGP